MALADDIAEKKRALDAARPLPHHVVARLADWFELETTIACAVVEGDRLTRREVMLLFAKGEPVLRNRPIDDQRMILNHRRALELMARLSFQSGGVVTERTIQAFHSLLFNGVGRTAGRYRDGPLKDGSAGASPDPAKVRVSMSALSGWLRRAEPSPDTAFEAHHRMMAVRPFDAGNATVALLLGNLILNRAGYPPVVVRETNRDAYFDTMQRAWSVGDKTPFRDVMMGLLNQSLDVCLVGAAGSLAGQVEEPEPVSRP